MKIIFGNIVPVFASISLVFYSCDLPYTPKAEGGLSTQNQIVNTNSDVIIKKINTDQQVCNPSISKDTINFKSCMLWLNFGGPLSVTVPAGMSGYSKSSEDHDRLTITDAFNNVKWFMMKSTIIGDNGTDYQFQDPEWSAHPEYLATLFGNVNEFDKWSLYAVHPVTNHSIKLINQKVNENSTPHFWVSPLSTHVSSVTNPVYSNNGLLSKESVVDFFGTDEFKVVYSHMENNILSLYYVDYLSVDLKPVKLQRPEDNEKKYWNYESALISPDGKWVVYNAYLTQTSYESYIQELNPGSKPILIKAGISDPHWWVNPVSGQYYIIFSQIPGDNRVLAKFDPAFLKTGEIGKTFMQKVTLNSGLPSLFSVELGDEKLVVNLPLKGGLSPDGKYLCTGYNYAYIIAVQ